MKKLLNKLSAVAIAATLFGIGIADFKPDMTADAACQHHCQRYAGYTDDWDKTFVDISGCYVRLKRDEWVICSNCNKPLFKTGAHYQVLAGNGLIFVQWKFTTYSY